MASNVIPFNPELEAKPSVSVKPRKRTVIPHKGEVWVENGPKVHWIIKRVTLNGKTVPEERLDQMVTEELVLLRFQLAREDHPRTKKWLAYRTLKHTLSRKDIHALEYVQSVRKLHACILAEGGSQDDIKSWNRFFGIDESIKPRLGVILGGKDGANPEP